jgi:hypothetical protein
MPPPSAARSSAIRSCNVRSGSGREVPEKCVEKELRLRSSASPRESATRNMKQAAVARRPLSAARVLPVFAVHASAAMKSRCRPRREIKTPCRVAITESSRWDRCSRTASISLAVFSRWRSREANRAVTCRFCKDLWESVRITEVFSNGNSTMPLPASVPSPHSSTVSSIRHSWPRGPPCSGYCSRRGRCRSRGW